MKSLKKKKEKPVNEPQYYTSATNMQTYNYKVYYMKPAEKLLYFLLAFAVGAAVGYLFYGGLFKDVDGAATTATWISNILISGTVGIIAGKMFIPLKTKSIIENQQRKLKMQFRDMLDALDTSLGAGKNVVDSFQAAYDDLKVQYDENAYIVKELEIILSGIANNVDMEELLSDFGKRSGNDDIAGFANVFKICYRKGGNIKDTIRSTHAILSDKMEITEDIETIVTSNKTEQKIMIVMPILIIAMIKLLSPDFAAKFATLSGVLATTVAIVMFVISYFVGKSILKIKL